MTSIPSPIKVNPRTSVQDYANRVLGASGTPQPNLMDRGAVKVMGQPTQSAATLSAAQRPTQQAATPDSIRQSTSQMHNDRMAAIRQARNRSRAAMNESIGVPDFQRPSGPSAPRGADNGPRGAYGLTGNAAAALARLQAAYRQRFGQDLGVLSGGRTRQEQEHLYALYKSGRGNLAAPPGTSVHESGRAVDFAGAAHNRGTVQNNWLKANAASFGWIWTGKNFSQIEDWHFEYQG